MKKIVLAGLMLGLAAAAFAIDFNLDARTDLLYTSYIRNSAYTALAAMQTMTAVNVFEKLRLKAKASIEPVKFDFDGRVYLKPSDEILTYAIDSAYFSFESGPLVIYAGKQRLKWGTGYFWNPSDKLQPAKNIFYTTEDLEGVFALRAEYTNDIITPSVILIPDYAANNTVIPALQLYKLIGTCDIYLNYIYKKDYLNSLLSYSSIGAAISWDVGLFVLNAEAAIKMWTRNLLDRPNLTSPNFVAGISKTIEDFFFNAEYYRNNSGMDNTGYASVVETAGFGPAMNKKDYLAYTASYTWDQRFAFALTGLHGLDDGTFYLFPSVSYMENQNFDVMLSWLQNFTGAGIKEGNYSTPFYNAVELRINAYF